MAQRDGSRTATTSTMERFVIIVNGWKPLPVSGSGSPPAIKVF